MNDIALLTTILGTQTKKDSEQIQITIDPSAKTVNFHVTMNFETLQVLNFQTRSARYLTYREDKLKDIAIKNLVKIRRLLELNGELESGQITDEEFDQELESNPKRYVINITNKANFHDAYLISQIIHRCDLQDELTIDEAAEMFSLDQQCLINIANHGGRILFDR